MPALLTGRCRRGAQAYALLPPHRPGADRDRDHAAERDEAFADLGLVVVDEQHRFGVEQRAGARKGQSPHALVLTATIRARSP
jgi:ATP-dependent DNA helicase RecG